MYNKNSKMEKRDKIVPVRYTKEEEDKVKKKARTMGLSVSTFIRLVSLEKSND